MRGSVDATFRATLPGQVSQLKVTGLQPIDAAGGGFLSVDILSPESAFFYNIGAVIQPGPFKESGGDIQSDVTVLYDLPIARLELGYNPFLQNAIGRTFRLGQSALLTDHLDQKDARYRKKSGIFTSARSI